MQSKAFKTEVVLSIITRHLLCEFDEMHKCIEFIAGAPVFTHQLADDMFLQLLRCGIMQQHTQLKGVGVDGISRTNWKRFRDELVERFGPELEIVPFPIGEDEIARSFADPIAGKSVVLAVEN